MAFSIYASTSDVTTQLNDGLPFRVESAEGLSGSDILRHTQRGPLQNGATDLGYRLQPAVLTLNLVFTATDDSTLDGYRDALMAAFTPLASISTFLSVQRDDDEIRTLTCFRVGDIDIALAPELRPGHTHRATVQLRAASPLWEANSVTSGTATFTGLGTWWTAGGTISSGLRTAVEYPAVGTTNLASYGTANWGVAFVTAKDTSAEPTAYAWSGDGYEVFRRNALGSVFIQNISPLAYGTPWPGETDYNYHLVENRSGTIYWRYWDGTALALRVNTVDGTASFDVDFNTRIYWRHNVASGTEYWTPEIRKAAVYFGSLSLDQYNALGPYLLNIVQGSVTLVNDGDVNAYPVISLRGPMADPIIVNQSAGGTINLTGGTIIAGATWTIDLSNGDKRIYDQDGNSVLGSVTTTPIAMADFVLAPAPIVGGGTNVLVLTPGSIGSAATFRAEITNRYMSF